MQGQYEEAEKLFRNALGIWREVFGKEHPNTAIAYNNLTNNISKQSRFAKAELLFKKALEISQRVLGEEHPQTKTIRENLEALLAKKDGG